MTNAETIAYRVRIGVTGHRALPEDPALLEQVRRALRRLCEVLSWSPSTPIQLSLISPLAEGADRLVARAVLEQPGATLEALLPLAREEYVRDFSSEQSRQEFEALLSRARRVATMPRLASRDEAYEEVGLAVLANCDVLIAVWDGLPGRGRGGTAEIVGVALQSGMPVYQIDSTPPFALVERPGAGLHLDNLRRLDLYNREVISPHVQATETPVELDHLLEFVEAAHLDPDAVLDFVFASKSMASRVTTRALNSTEEWGPSDHCQVRIDVE